MADPAYIVDGVLTDGEAWVGIAHASLSLPAATVTWTSTDDGQTGDFSQYMDLVIVSYARSDRSSDNDLIGVQFSNDTTSSYSGQYVSGNGSSASASYITSETYGYVGYPTAATATANIFGAFVTHIFDINSGKYKSMLTSAAADRDGAGDTGLYVATWRKQTPISEIDLVLPLTGADFVAGSSFSLFGVLPRMVA
jgi:hypothetical protein